MFSKTNLRRTYHFSYLERFLNLNIFIQLIMRLLRMVSNLSDLVFELIFA